MTPLAPVDARHLFRPVSQALVALLRDRPADDWTRPTIAGSWRVRDVVAHLIDLTLRRLSFHRDGMTPPPPSRPIQSERDFIDFINGINATWVDASTRLSPHVLTDLFDRASAELADWFEAQPLEGPALFGVSWAGEQASDNWFDIGREFTELWHHQQQIRLAVGAEALADPRYLHAVLNVALRGLPHAFRAVAAESGDTITLDITGAAGGQWSLVRTYDDTWALQAGATPEPAARVTMSDDAAWRLLFNALPESEARQVVQVEGRADLVEALFKARSVLV
jgi:uncharacterized protein (TIGR03083 family)